MTNLGNLAGAERPVVADADRARDKAIQALDALNKGRDEEPPAYWLGYLAAALEGIIFDLRAGA